jgi:hypothetical protein
MIIIIIIESAIRRKDVPLWHGSRHCYDESAHSLPRLRLSMSGLPTLYIVVIVPTMVLSSSFASYAAGIFVIVKVKDVVRSDHLQPKMRHTSVPHRPEGPSRSTIGNRPSSNTSPGTSLSSANGGEVFHGRVAHRASSPR